MAWRIGGAGVNASESIEPEVAVPLQQAGANSSELHPLLQEVPLFTPLLSEKRFVVQQSLDRLRQHQWLKLAE